MRLIDADKLKEYLQEYLHYEHAIPWIDAQPTAFNIEKVVEQMEEQKEVYSPVAQEGYFKGKVAGLCDAIDIVKRGGVNDD